MSQITQNDIIKTVASALDVEEASISLDSKAEDVPGWDSIGQLGVLVALDEIFDGKISSIDEMASAHSIKKIIELLQKNNLI